MSDEMEIEIIVPAGPDETDALTHGLVGLTEAIAQVDAELVAHGFLGGEFGYGARFENDVFVMRPFYWGDCDCGANERGEAWHAANEHSAECFRSILQRRFAEYDEDSGYNAIDAATHAPGMMESGEDDTAFGTVIWSKRTPAGEAAHERWCQAHDAQRKAHDRLTAELYDEVGLPRSPYQWLCTCGVDERAQAFFATEGHRQTCALELPNFRHKASGLEVRWYKWIGRDMEIVSPSAPNYQAIFAECLASLPPTQEGKR